MELGKTIGVSPIKLENKYSIKEIDEIVYEINDILYYFNNKYINSKAKDYIKEKVTVLGKKLNNTPTNGDRTQRKAELLDKMRNVYSALSKYIPDDNQQQIVNMCKYQLAIYIKNKETMTEEDIFKLMKDNVLFTKIYGYSEKIDSIQRELLKRYQLSEE